MKEQVLKQSQVFWKGLEKADTAAMHSVCDDKCFFVHIGGNCDLDREMDETAGKPEDNPGTGRT